MEAEAKALKQERLKRRGMAATMKRIWLLHSHHEPLTAQQVQDLVLQQRGPSSKWQLETTAKHMRALLKFGLIKRVGREGYLIVGLPTGKDFPSDDECYEAYLEACRWWVNFQCRGGTVR